MNKEKKTRIIKRYQNRKLYDTENSCYVTLDDVAKFIKEGEDVCIIDNRSQEDLTTLTLTQIILEEGKKKKHLLPLGTLKNIIQSGGEHLVDLFQKSIHTVSSISNVKDEAEKVIDKIKDEIEDGGIFVRDFISKTHDSLDEVTKKFEDKVKSIGKLTNASFLKAEIRTLMKKVEEFEKKIK